MPYKYYADDMLRGDNINNAICKRFGVTISSVYLYYTIVYIYIYDDEYEHGDNDNIWSGLSADRWSMVSCVVLVLLNRRI